MTAYQFLLAMQYASIALMMFMCAYITKKWKKPLHGWLFFYCTMTLINNAGYLALMLARSEEAAVLAWQICYLGRVWIPFAFLQFVLILCKQKRRLLVLNCLALIHALTYFLVLFMRHNSLYYTSIEWSEDGLFPHATYTNGIWHFVFDVLVILYIIYGLSLLFIRLRAQKNPQKKKQLVFIIAAIATDSLFYIIKLLHVIPGYDMTVMGYTLATIFLYIAVFRYDMLGTKELARDFVIDRVSEGVIATSEDGTVSFCNEKAMTLFPELADVPDKVLADLKKLLAEEKPLFIEGRTYTLKEDVLKNGAYVAGKVYVLSDDTEHFRYIAELKEQKQIADKANNAKSEFLSNMSHEIRSPINAVLGLDEMILRESGEAQIKGYAADIQSSGKMLLSVINDILDFSKIESGKMEIIPVDYDLSCVIADLVNMTASKADAKGLRFIVDVDEAMPHRLFGDDTRLKQCILNILTNAVKYTPSGSVTLKVSAEKTGGDSCALFVSVTDTGIGIKAEDIKKLFSPFERIEEGRNRAIEGTGLGMSIVKSLLAAMGTQLDVQSEYGKGSCFSFRVEQEVHSWEAIGDYRATKAAALKNASAYTESFQAPEAKILVVDDTPVNLTVMRGLLKQTRLQIDTAADGIEGLEKAGAQKYDVIFIDHRMPKMDGVQMIRALRTDGKSMNQKTVCVALTASVAGNIREEYIEAGFEDYLSKPVEPKLLEALLVHYLPSALVLHKGDEGWADSPIPATAAPAPAIVQKTQPQVSGAADAFLAKKFGISFASALAHCGDEEVLAQALQGFYDAIEAKAESIERYAEAQDWQNYTVLVHALKSSARLIGADGLSEQAAALEALGDKAMALHDAEVTATIAGQTPALLADYRAYTAKLAPLCARAGQGGASTLPALSQAELNERLSVLREFAAAFDFDSVDAIMAELAAHALPATYVPQYKQLQAAVLAADRAAILTLLGGN